MVFAATGGPESWRCNAGCSFQSGKDTCTQARGSHAWKAHFLTIQQGETSLCVPAHLCPGELSLAAESAERGAGGQAAPTSGRHQVLPACLAKGRCRLTQLLGKRVRSPGVVGRSASGWQAGQSARRWTCIPSVVPTVTFASR